MVVGLPGKIIPVDPLEKIIPADPAGKITPVDPAWKITPADPSQNIPQDQSEQKKNLVVPPSSLLMMSKRFRKQRLRKSSNKKFYGLLITKTRESQMDPRLNEFLVTNSIGAEKRRVVRMKTKARVASTEREMKSIDQTILKLSGHMTIAMRPLKGQITQTMTLETQDKKSKALAVRR
jgi:hypothetical protein